MKKIAILVVLAVITVTTTFAKTPGNETENALVTFNQKFSDAKEVSWYKTNDHVEVRFKLNEQVMYAYFTETGELLGITRNLPSTQLPINLQTDFKKNFPGKWVTELFEYASDYETAYYLTLEDADQKITLKNAGGNSWTVFRKTKKM